MPSTPKPHTERAAAGPGRARREEAELRVFGLNACRAVFARRPQAIRKVYLLPERLAELKPILVWCAQARIGYNLVESDDLERLTKSGHHEGVVFDVRREPPLRLNDWLSGLDRRRPCLAVWLDGVGNPHNFGAALRIAAHFAVDGLLLSPGSSLNLSGAACRVAEGGAEYVPLVALDDIASALHAVARAGLETLATVVRGGDALYTRPLPRRAVVLFGAEGGGVGPGLLAAVPRQVRIPGSGVVESLNIATAVGVVAAEHWRQYRV